MNHILKINKQNVISNIETCRGSKEVCLMVKANNYGIGDSGLSMLIESGYTFFGVSTIEEALKLRGMNSEIKILIVSYIELSDITTCVDNNITFTVYDDQMLRMLTANCLFHLKVDTNMGRLGFQLSELEEVREYLLENNLTPEGIFSHLACASDEQKTQIAIDNFKQALSIFADFDFKYTHLLNTYGSLNYQTDFDNLVRIGIGMWGYFATEDEKNLSSKSLKPALSLSLTVSHSKNYQGFISYDHLDVVDGMIITVPLGYHDGFARTMRLFHIKDVGVVVGNVNMCQHMILLDEGVTFKRGDLYQLFEGDQLYKICEYTNVTVYEFLVSLSSRMKRVID